MVQVAGTRFSFEDYLTYDDGSDTRYELFDGELLPMTPPTGEHGAIVAFLLIQFYLEIQRLGLTWQVRPGDTGVRTTPSRSRLPDLCMITAEQAEAIRHQVAILESAPFLVVEVVSPDSVNRDYRYKRSEYATLGIPEYWIVDPTTQKVSVLRLEEGFYEVSEFQGDDRISSPTFVELALTAEQVLRG